MSKRGFSLGDYLKDPAMSKTDTVREQIEYIDLDRIDPDPENFYSLDGLDELAGNIELVGLQQPLRVRPNGERFVIVSGHRRRAACLLIRDGGNPMFDQGVPCLVDYGEASDAMRELRLIFANSATRVMSSAEQSKQAERVTELLYQLKEQGVEFPGRMRDHVAEACNLSRSKIGRLQAIRANLIDDFLGLYDDGKINESMAYRISQETTQTQIQIWKDQGSVIQHLTVDGISSYVAQLRFMQNRKVEPAGPAISRPQKDDCGPMRAASQECRTLPARQDAPTEDEDDDEDDGRQIAAPAEIRPTWYKGTPPQAGRYYARIDMGDGGTHEAVGEYRGGSWSVFGGPLYESMKVVGWWPLPERM